MRRIFRKLRYLKKRQNGKPVITLYTSADGIRREVVDKESMERACIQENQTRFSQANGTPFLQKPLVDAVGLIAEKQGAQDIIDGTFVCEGLDEMTEKFIAQLKKPEHVFSDQLLGSFVTTDHIKGWKRAKARMVSEHTGLSFDHHKAGIVDK